MKCVPEVLVALCVAAFASTGTGQEPAKWLLVAGSSRTVSAALQVNKKIAVKWPHVTIVASDDCQGLKPGLFLTVAETSKDRPSAEDTLPKLKVDVPDSYVRECRPKSDTMLSLGLPLVDPTIEHVPSDAVNWSDRDRISSVIKLPTSGYLWIRRWYLADPNDPREGRRESLLFFAQNPHSPIELQADCAAPYARQLSHWLALSCERGVAADNLLHETVVLDTASGKAVYSVQHCRKPEFISDSEITCEDEKVNAEGQLALKTKRLQFH